METNRQKGIVDGKYDCASVRGESRLIVCLKVVMVVLVCGQRVVGLSLEAS